MTNVSVPTGVPLWKLRAEVRESSAEEVAKRFRLGFLLLSRVSSSTSENMRRSKVDTDVMTTGKRAMMLIPLVRRDDAPYDVVTIGRSPNSDVMLDEASISRLHAYVHDEDGEAFLMDAGSSNGTVVNGKPISRRGEGKPTALKDGDRVELGDVAVNYVTPTAAVELVMTVSKLRGED
jgi:pSer/pThr/pTyr-binding forkhead associated (FHA) protein